MENEKENFMESILTENLKKETEFFFPQQIYFIFAPEDFYWCFLKGKDMGEEIIFTHGAWWQVN